MAFIPVPNAIKVALEFSIGGQLLVLTIGLQKASAVTLTDLQNAANGAKNWYTTYLQPITSDELRLNNVVAYDLTSASGPVHNLPVTSGNIGSITSDPIPNNVAAVISWRTANRGRSGRGRMYVGGFGITQTNSPVLMAPSLQSGLAVAAANLSGFFTPSGLTHVVVSRFTGGAPRTTGVTFPVTSYVVDQSFDSQRRRLQGRGI